MVRKIVKVRAHKRRTKRGKVTTVRTHLRYITVGVGLDHEDDYFAFHRTKKFALKDFNEIKRDKRFIIAFMGKVEKIHRKKLRELGMV